MCYQCRSELQQILFKYCFYRESLWWCLGLKFLFLRLFLLLFHIHFKSPKVQLFSFSSRYKAKSHIAYRFNNCNQGCPYWTVSTMRWQLQLMSGYNQKATSFREIISDSKSSLTLTLIPAALFMFLARFALICENVQAKQTRLTQNNSTKCTNMLLCQCSCCVFALIQWPVQQFKGIRVKWAQSTTRIVSAATLVLVTVDELC